MPGAHPHVREAGSGPGVVCIHCNASNSAQWRGLMELLSPSHRVLAPDCYGAGKSPDWPSDREITLRDEVDFIEPVLAQAGGPFALVGHSVRRWGHALFAEPTPVQAFAALDMPILYMLGESSPLSAHAVAKVLVPVLPNVQVVEFPGLGHMAPLTHPEAINAAIARFLSQAR